MIIDVDALMPKREFEERMSMLIGDMHSAEKMAGVSQIYVPGEFEHDREQAAFRDNLTRGRDLAGAPEIASDFGVEAELAAAIR